jgi:hypothetical protein
MIIRMSMETTEPATSPSSRPATFAFRVALREAALAASRAVRRLGPRRVVPHPAVPLPGGLSGSASSGSSSGSTGTAPTPGSALPTAPPTNTPTAAILSPVLVAIPNADPTLLTTATATPSLSNCHGSTAEKRIEQLLQILDAETDSTNLPDDVITARSQATKWLLNDYQVYPDDEELIQRWALAVVYFSTGGDEWFQCRRASADPPDSRVTET